MFFSHFFLSYRSLDYRRQGNPRIYSSEELSICDSFHYILLYNRISERWWFKMLVKTIKLQLYPTSEQIELFRETQSVFTEACNFVSNYVFKNDFELSQRKLHDVLYRILRSQFNLQSQMAQSVIKTVIARYKSVNTNMKQKPYQFRDNNTGIKHRVKRDMYWLKQPIQFNSKVAVLVRNRNYSLLKTGEYSIATQQGRVKVACDKSNLDYLRQFNDYKLGEAELLERRGKWYLHISASKEVETVDTNEIKHVVGIDRGLRYLITAYDEKGKTLFINGQDVIKKRRHFKSLRSELQSKNTKSSKKRLKTIEKRENRWMNDVNHCISKALVDRYGQNTLFVLEDLTGVTFDTVNHRKKESRYEHMSWSFFDLEKKLIYKSFQNQSMVVKVSAQYTSQRCPKCGAIHKENRIKAKHLFKCIQCGYQSNDDRVAGMNIQMLGAWYMSGDMYPKFEKLEPKLEY